ncbi:MAG: hypothetical protein AB8A32_04945, partial [Prochlorococcus sp.]
PADQKTGELRQKHLHSQGSILKFARFIARVLTPSPSTKRCVALLYLFRDKKKVIQQSDFQFN